MQADFLIEPELEFGVDRHVDIRFGVMNYGPVDYAHPLAPKEIRLGIVGTNVTIEGLQKWLERCRNEIPAKASRQPNLFPKFPGFQPDTSFRSTLIFDSRLQRSISPREFINLAGATISINEKIEHAVDLFYAELKYLEENTNANVLMCAIPQDLLELTQGTGSPGQREGVDTEADDETGQRLNFHHWLKARSMNLKIPIQLIVPSTYDETKRPRQKRRSELVRRSQDEATRAWNLHTALYYKAKGVPWRLVRNPTDLATCYVGISFYKTLDGATLLTSVAQVFNERGEGVVVRGGTAKLSKDDRQVHLEGEDARKLLDNALALYKTEHKNFPARVVIHKTSIYTPAEADGFSVAAHSHGIDLLDLLSIDDADTRLFRLGAYPPLRGTLLHLDARDHILYTRGSVDFFATYPGLYVPHPLLFRCEQVEQTPRFLALELLGLTKMNWNNTQFDGSEPITIRAARQVSSILKYVGPNEVIASAYRHYM